MGADEETSLESSCREIDPTTLPGYEDLLIDADFEEEVDDDDDDESFEPPSEKEAAESQRYIVDFPNIREFIHSLVEVMDWRKWSINDVQKGLQNMHKRGNGNPAINISRSMVDRMQRRCRDEAVEELKQLKFPEQGALHFDEVKVSLGAQQGGRKIEHLVATVTGLGGERKLGVFEVINGKGYHYSNLNEKHLLQT